jgi:pimeloyl-ACP methyl ester carboxylesterase
VVFIHGNVSSSLFWQETMQDLPPDLRVIAIDLRGFGGTEHAPIDATRGVRDFSDDVRETLAVLGIPTAHLVGWSMGGGVILQYALDHPVLSLTLQAPVSPYGFGGTEHAPIDAPAACAISATTCVRRWPRSASPPRTSWGGRWVAA